MLIKNLLFIIISFLSVALKGQERILSVDISKIQGKKKILKIDSVFLENKKLSFISQGNEIYKYVLPEMTDVDTLVSGEEMLARKIFEDSVSLPLVVCINDNQYAIDIKKTYFDYCGIYHNISFEYYKYRFYYKRRLYFTVTSCSVLSTVGPVLKQKKLK